MKESYTIMSKKDSKELSRCLDRLRMLAALTDLCGEALKRAVVSGR